MLLQKTVLTKIRGGFVGVNNEGATINVGGSGNTGMFGNNSDVVRLWKYQCYW